MHWRNEKPGRRKYDLYMNSREWQLKKRKVKERSGGICERCRDYPSEAVHHLHYRNLYKEPPEDLLDVCKGCHDYIHDRSSKDPVTEAIDRARIDGGKNSFVYSKRLEELLSYIASVYDPKKCIGLPLRMLLPAVYEQMGILEIILRVSFLDGNPMRLEEQDWLVKKASQYWAEEFSEYQWFVSYQDVEGNLKSGIRNSRSAHA